MQSHYDNPLVEQRELLTGKRVIELDDRSVIRISGADRQEWLHSMLSQRLNNLSAGSSAEAMLLDAQGHIEQDFQLIEDGESTWLICYSAEASKLLRWFDMVIFRSKVEVGDASGDVSVIGSFGGPLPGIAHGNATALVWKDPWMAEPTGSVRYAAAGGREGWDFYLNLVDKHTEAEALAGFGRAGSLAFDALRVAAHRPWQPNELDEKSLPHELDWLSSAVHLSKGCYRGQESVAKVHNLGHPPRRIVMLHLDGSADTDASAGDLVMQGEREIGRITTIGQHFELGPIALAVVARTADDSADWQVKTSGATVAAKAQTIVPPTAGAAAGIREKRTSLLG